MEIYVVQAGDTLNAIAQRSGLSAERIASENRLFPLRASGGADAGPPFPRPGLHRPVRRYALFRGSGQRRTGPPALPQQHRPGGLPHPLPRPDRGPQLSGRQRKILPIAVNGYAYPFIDPGLLRRTLPFLTYITPFTYGIQPDGALVPLEDQALLTAARNVGTGALMHLSTLTDEGSFSNELASLVLNDQDVQGVLIDNVLNTLEAKGYSGLDVDFEFVFPRMRRPMPPSSAACGNG